MMDRDTMDKVAMIIGFSLAVFLVFCFIMATQTDIPFFEGVINGLMEFFSGVGAFVLIGLLVLVGLIAFAPAVLIGILILAGAAVVLLLILLLAALFV